MKNLSMKTLIIYSIPFLGLFGIVDLDEVVTETTQPVVSVTGEFVTDITFGGFYYIYKSIYWISIKW